MFPSCLSVVFLRTVGAFVNKAVIICQRVLRERLLEAPMIPFLPPSTRLVLLVYHLVIYPVYLPLSLLCSFTLISTYAIDVLGMSLHRALFFLK